MSKILRASATLALVLAAVTGCASTSTPTPAPTPASSAVRAACGLALQAGLRAYEIDPTPANANTPAECVTLTPDELAAELHTAVQVVAASALARITSS